MTTKIEASLLAPNPHDRRGPRLRLLPTTAGAIRAGIKLTERTRLDVENAIHRDGTSRLPHGGLPNQGSHSECRALTHGLEYRLLVCR